MRTKNNRAGYWLASLVLACVLALFVAPRAHAAPPSGVGEIIAALPLSPDLVVTGISLLFNLVQAIRQKNTSAALGAVVDGVEKAASLETNPKKQIALATAGTVAGAIIDEVVQAKGYKRTSRR